MSTPTWPVAAASFALGFAVAQATGVRPLGGGVLLAGALWCAARWRRRGPGVALALLVLFAACFALSHALADPLGAWPAVAVLAAVLAAAAWALADRAETVTAPSHRA